MATLKHPIEPCFWLNKGAKQAAKFYVSIFPGSRILSRTIMRDTPGGDCEVVYFRLGRQKFLVFDTNKWFKFNESLSLVIYCDTQKEIEYYAKKLSAHPKSEQCGWVKDKFGVSWQITPAIMPKMYQEGNPAQIARMTQAMMKMRRLDIAALKKAYSGK